MGQRERRAIAVAGAALLLIGCGSSEPPSVASVIVTLGVNNLLVGQTTTAVASALGIRSEKLSGRPISWNSSNPSVATVSGSGESATVTAVTPGTANITATSEGKSSQPQTITVTGVVRLTAVAPNPVTLIVQRQQLLTAQITADPGLSTLVSWTSSNPAIASVPSAQAASAIVTGVGRGTTTIVARAVGDPTQVITVPTTVLGVSAINVTPKQDSIRVGATRTFQRAVTADAGVDTTATWSSSSQSVATVSSTGLVTGVSVGTANIVATANADGRQTAQGTIKVMDPCDLPLSITIGQSVATSFNATSCRPAPARLPEDRVAWTLSAAQSGGYMVTATAPFTQHLTFTVPGWFWGPPFNTPLHLLLGAGSYAAIMQAESQAASGSASFSLSPWNGAGCHEVIATPGIEIDLALDQNCVLSPDPPGPHASGTYFRYAIDILPGLTGGDAVTATVSSTTFQPRLMTWDFDRSIFDQQALPTGTATTTSLTYVQPSGSQRVLRIVVSSVAPIATGSFHLKLSAVLH
jgi:uncharacterized protein YjdB